MDDTLISVSALDRHFKDCTAPELEMLYANLTILLMRRMDDSDRWHREQREYYSQFADESLRF